MFNTENLPTRQEFVRWFYIQDPQDFESEDYISAREILSEESYEAVTALALMTKYRSSELDPVELVEERIFPFIDMERFSTIAMFVLAMIFGVIAGCLSASITWTILSSSIL